jgi:hypothetical protein
MKICSSVRELYYVHRSTDGVTLINASQKCERLKAAHNVKIYVMETGTYEVDLLGSHKVSVKCM